MTRIPRDWLVVELPSFDWEAAMRFELRRAGLDEAGADALIERARPRPHAGWDELVAAASPGDSLWYFRSPPETWNELAGRAGFAVVRHGVPVAALVTTMS